VFAYYNAANLLEAIKFSTPSGPTLGGACLTTAKMQDAFNHLLSLDPETRLGLSGATSTKLGIGVCSITRPCTVRGKRPRRSATPLRLPMNICRR
jgi:hypothetical protein